MFGVADDLRCPNCAQKRRNKYVGPRVARERTTAPVTIAVIVLATAATAIPKLLYPPLAKYLVATPESIWAGHVWLYMTTTLVHANLLHWFFNLYMLWRFGVGTEIWMGPLRYAGYLILLAFGSMALQFLAAPQNPAVGLSGVVYGLFGTLYALRRRKAFAAEIMQPQLIQALVFWFFLCIVLTQMGTMMVANVAHGGGAVLGWLIGEAILRRERILLIAGVIVLTAALVFSTLWMPWDGTFCLYMARTSSRQGDDQAANDWFDRALSAPRNPIRDLN